ncbi:MAG: hypothetical protein GXP13_08620 [Gammaproteobacteria bacterium]|nr:hypothetical protein [Gammaproteobacteria bacterium]
MEKSTTSRFLSPIMFTGTLLATLIVMTACGGGGSSPTSGSTFSGTISSFGSVFINGIEFETGNSSISIDDINGNEDDLKVGMQVTVEGSVNSNGSTGTATKITFKDDIEGLVIANNIGSGQTTGTIDVMGQTVTVTDNTIIEGVATPDLITSGMIVEVSGHSSGTGSISATRIEVKAADFATYLATHSEGVEVKGVIINHDQMNSKFDIGGITVDYSAAILKDMPTGSFDSLYVEIKSTSGIDGVSGELIASRVEIESTGEKGHDGDDNEEMDIKGLITSGINGNSFSVDGEQITVNDKTEFEGISKSDLMAGVMIKVEGYYLNGELIADEISAERESSNKVSGTVESKTKTTTATNSGMVTLTSGLVVTVTSETIMKDSRDNGFMPDPKFNLQSLSQGDYVEIRYYTKNGVSTATKLERDDM